jgi:hypothetical protein
MKIKRFDIVKLQFDVETEHQISARLIILSKIHTLIRFGKIQPTLNGMKCGRPFYRLYIPKIRIVNGSDSV